MRHKEAEELISLRLDDLLNEAQEEALDEHLAACPRCAELWQRMSAVSDMLAGQPSAAPPADFVSHTMERVRARRRRERIWLWVRRALLLLLGGLLLAGGALLSLTAAAASRPALFRMALSLGISLLSLGGVLYDALGVFLRVTLRGTTACLYLGWAALAGAVLGLWLLLLRRAGGILQGRIDGGKLA